MLYTDANMGKLSPWQFTSIEQTPRISTDPSKNVPTYHSYINPQQKYYTKNAFSITHHPKPKQNNKFINSRLKFSCGKQGVFKKQIKSERKFPINILSFPTQPIQNKEYGYTSIRGHKKWKNRQNKSYEVNVLQYESKKSEQKKDVRIRIKKFQPDFTLNFIKIRKVKRISVSERKHNLFEDPKKQTKIVYSHLRQSKTTQQLI